ncbi:DUF350 domain-containing protein [Runella limosa]|uniref:DUF350 domain-containing protein n=1 Tax=Runella limosa TaxID=370978 RepID=UPI00040F3A75|nr:hypothetical protein [Runella limosa]
MNTTLFFSALLQILLSLFIGVILLYGAYQILNQIIARKYKIDPSSNIDYAILCSGILFAVGYLASNAMIPIQNAIRIVQKDGGSFVESAKYIIYFLLVSVVVAFLVVLISLWLWGLLTRKINELDQVNKNNIPVALITTTIVILLSLFVRDGFVMLLESLIPYPSIPNYF